MLVDELVEHLKARRAEVGNIDVRLQDTSDIDGMPQDVDITMVTIKHKEDKPYVVII